MESKMKTVRRGWVVDELRSTANLLINLGFESLGRQVHHAAAEVGEGRCDEQLQRKGFRNESHCQ